MLFNPHDTSSHPSPHSSWWREGWIPRFRGCLNSCPWAPAARSPWLRRQLWDSPASWAPRPGHLSISSAKGSEAEAASRAQNQWLTLLCRPDCSYAWRDMGPPRRGQGRGPPSLVSTQDSAGTEPEPGLCPAASFVSLPQHRVGHTGCWARVTSSAGRLEGDRPVDPGLPLSGSQLR